MTKNILTHENEELRECARLGDLFLAFDFEDEDSAAEAEAILVDILMESNAQCVNIIYNALTLACSETEEQRYLDIISGTNFKAKNYIDANEFNDYSNDIICTISEINPRIGFFTNEEKMREAVFDTSECKLDANGCFTEPGIFSVKVSFRGFEASYSIKVEE